MGRRRALSDATAPEPVGGAPGSERPLEPAPAAPERGAARWVRALPLLVAAIAIATLYGVFALPWLVHAKVVAVSSDSQMLGFSNRTAIISLALGSLALLLVGLIWRLGDTTRAESLLPVVNDTPAEKSERVDRWLVGVLMVLSVGVVAIIGRLYGMHPFSDAAYEVDRMLRLFNGGTFYGDFEFAYGPLLFYPAVWVYQVLKLVGVGIYSSYYVTVGLFHILGLAMATYLVDRLQLSRAWRNACVVLVFSFGIFMVSLGLNYLPVRFLTPFVALVWVVGVSRRNVWWGAGAAVAAVGLAFGVSPEMGIAALVGIAVTTGALVARRNWLLAAPLLGALAAGAASYAWYARYPLSTFAQFGQGAYNLPALPGQIDLMFVATMLVLGLGVGLTTNLADERRSALQGGWYAMGVVLIAAAFGRADYGHVFWNGLGAILLTVAIAERAWKRLSPAYFGATAAVYVITAMAVAVMAVPSMYASAVNGGLVSKRQSMKLAVRLGRTEETGRQWFNGAVQPEPDPADVKRLIAAKGIFMPYMIQGRIGPTLAENHALSPVFAIPGLVMSPQQNQLLLGSLAKSNYILLPQGEYSGLLAASKSRSDTESPTFMRRPISVTDYGLYSMLELFPLRTHPANKVYEPVAVLGAEIRRDWVTDRISGGYVILKRR